MSTALIVTADLGGNVPPALGIGRELRRRGWTVLVLADLAQRGAVEAAGLDFRPSTGAAPYDPLVARNPIRGLRDIVRVFSDRGRGGDTVRLARESNADVVLVDGLLIGALDECRRAGLPTAALVHTTWLWFQRSMSRGPIAALIRRRGLEPLAVVSGTGAVLVATTPVLQAGVPLPQSAVVTGPVLQEPAVQASRQERPRVLVSFSSLWYPGQPKAIRKVLAATASLPVDVLVTTGPSLDPATVRAPANATVHGVLDHGSVLPQLSLVVGHGGHATTVRALAHGVPLLIIPMHPMLDQPLIGRAVAAAGAGLTLRKSARPKAIRAAVQHLLDEPAFAATAARIGEELRGRDGAIVAADALAGLAGLSAQSRPVRLQASSDASPASPSS